MRISVNTENDTIPLEVAEDLELENFKALCEIEVGIPFGEMVVVFNAQPLTDNKKSLKDYGVKDGELLMIIRGSTLLRRAAEHRRQQQQQQQQRQQQAVPAEISQIDFSNIQLPGAQQTNTSSAAADQTPSGNKQGQRAGQEGEEERLNGDGDLGLGIAGGNSVKCCPPGWLKVYTVN